MNRNIITVVCLTKESSGGLGYFLDQLYSLSNDGYSIKYLLFNTKTSFSTFTKHAVFINKNYPKHTLFSFAKIHLAFSNAIRTYRYIQKHQPKIIFACDIYSIILTTILKLVMQSNIKTVIHFNIDIIALVRSKSGIIYKLALMYFIKTYIRQNDQFVCVSRGLAKYLMDNLHIREEEMAIINSSLLNMDKSLDSIKLPKNQNKKLITVGRLGWPKDNISIIDAVIKMKRKNIELYIVGNGPDITMLKKYVKSKQMYERIKFLGWQKNSISLIKQADIFVFSSKSDAYPRVILEAIYAGKPIIASDCNYGPREILENGKYGILVPVSQSDSFAQKIEWLLSNSLRMKKYSKLALTRQKYFSLDKMISKYNSLFTNMINTN